MIVDISKFNLSMRVHQLANVTDECVAFKVNTTSPRRYRVRPEAGVSLPKAICNVTVTIIAPTRGPYGEWPEKIKVGATDKDFKVKDAKLVNKLKISVSYAPAKPPVPEGDKKGLLRMRLVNPFSSHAVRTCFDESHLVYPATALVLMLMRSCTFPMELQGNTLPLSWKTRFCIAAELCSTLIFLHSFCPHEIVHGDLKPSNILLDSNFTSKLSLSEEVLLKNNSALCCRNEPKKGWWLKGTFPYIDPEFLSTGELTTKSDVFSFGIIVLRLLTGKPALEIANEVQYVIDKGNLKDLLDPEAGDWPYVQLLQLAHLALRCADVTSENRPDLSTEVGRVLESMTVSSALSSLQCGSSGEHCQVPAYFVCPIFQETMQDPVIAADGFTYELEAIKAQLDRGHDTSPMTNLQLPSSTLVPNRALCSAIQEWFQQHPSSLTCR